MEWHAETRRFQIILAEKDGQGGKQMGNKRQGNLSELTVNSQRSFVVDPIMVNL